MGTPLGYAPGDNFLPCYAMAAWKSSQLADIPAGNLVAKAAASPEASPRLPMNPLRTEDRWT